MEDERKRGDRERGTYTNGEGRERTSEERRERGQWKEKRVNRAREKREMAKRWK